MTAVSLSISRGLNGLRISDFTVGTSAPGSGDVELRYNLTDTNSVAVTRKDIVIALEAFKRAIEAGGNIVTNAPPL